MSSGPATPIGTWAAPTSPSMLPTVLSGAKENRATCWSGTPERSVSKRWRAAISSGDWSCRMSLSYGT
jgi:hypothetical protein